MLWQLIVKNVSGAKDGVICIVELLEVCCNHELATGVFSQIVWQVALQIEVSLFRALKKGKQHADGFEVNSENILHAMGVPDRLNNILLRHVIAGASATEDVVNLSVALDKANVGGIGLENFCFVLPSGQGFWSPPQVFGGNSRILVSSNLREKLLRTSDYFGAPKRPWCIVVFLVSSRKRGKLLYTKAPRTRFSLREFLLRFGDPRSPIWGLNLSNSCRCRLRLLRARGDRCTAIQGYHRCRLVLPAQGLAEASGE
jgi:hypothetical protein